MGKNRKINLSKSDIDETIKVLESMQNDMMPEINAKIEEIMNQAVQKCIEFSGNFTEQRTYWEKTPTGYRLTQEGKGVVYVEFGTGVVGEEAEHHPLHEEMGLKPHGYFKEYKFTGPDGREAWIYPKSEGGKGITSGQPARMQLYKTAQWIKEQLDTEISYTMKGVTKKW